MKWEMCGCKLVVRWSCFAKSRAGEWPLGREGKKRREEKKCGRRKEIEVEKKGKKRNQDNLKNNNYDIY